MELGIAGFAADDQFDFILDQNGEEERSAIELFYKLKSDQEWPFSHRLSDYGAASAERFIPLQCAASGARIPQPGASCSSRFCRCCRARRSEVCDRGESRPIELK